MNPIDRQKAIVTILKAFEDCYYDDGEALRWASVALRALGVTDDEIVEAAAVLTVANG